MADVTSRVAPSPEQVTAIVGEFRREKSALGEQQKEIAILIKQAMSEVDRLVQRNRDISYQMRQLEANIDNFSRTEVKQVYSASQEAQMRLFMMQSQLEQLKSRQASLEKTEGLLDRILEVSDLVQEALAAGVSPEGEDRAGSASLQGPAVSGASERALQSIELAHRRISRQLQDGPAQVLADLILRAEVCERLLERDRQKAKEETARLRLAASGALKTTRQLIHELQPPALEELGLAAALRRYVDASRSAKAFSVDLQIGGKDRRLPSMVELAFFRVLQEAMANAARHSGADRVEVSLRFDPGQVAATVADRGRGFDVEAALAEAKRKDHSGLADMLLRAELIDGDLDLSSRPGSGCTVSLSIAI